MPAALSGNTVSERSMNDTAGRPLYATQSHRNQSCDEEALNDSGEAAETSQQHALHHVALPQEALPQQALHQHALPQHALPQQALPQHALPQHALHQRALPQPALHQHALPQQGQSGDKASQQEALSAVHPQVQRHVHWQDEAPAMQPHQTADLRLSPSTAQQQRELEDPFRASNAFPLLPAFADACCHQLPHATSSTHCSSTHLATCHGQHNSTGLATNTAHLSRHGPKRHSSSNCRGVNKAAPVTRLSGNPHQPTNSDFVTPVKAAELSSLGEQEFWDAARADLVDTAEAVRHPLHGCGVLSPVTLPSLAASWNGNTAVTGDSGITPLIGEDLQHCSAGLVLATLLRLPGTACKLSWCCLPSAT